MGNFLASLLWRLISYKSIFSILPELWNLICSCTKEKEIVLSNLFPDFHICPIQCSYYEASIKCKFHIACATSLHSSCADMLWKLTPRNQHFRNGHIVIWNKYNLKKLNRRKKKLLMINDINSFNIPNPYAQVGWWKTCPVDNFAVI